MRLSTRLARLKRTRPEPLAAVGLDLPPHVRTRIAAAQAAGTYPQSLSDVDLSAIVAAGDVMRGRT